MLKLKNFLAPKSLRYLSMKVKPVACLKDNYAYVVTASDETGPCFVVDPVSPSSVLQQIPPTSTCTTALVTHHHLDHAGGNTELKSLLPQVQIVGGDQRIQAVERLLKPDEELKIGKLMVKAIATPCHTTGHMSYLVWEDPEEKVIFTGDTLFIAGCGRFFEGTADQMVAAMEKYKALGPNVKVYCGHEYTRDNLQFALSVDPENEKLREKLQWAKKTACTLPSTIDDELETNPFMRYK